MIEGERPQKPSASRRVVSSVTITTLRRLAGAAAVGAAVGGGAGASREQPLASSANEAMIAATISAAISGEQERRMASIREGGAASGAKQRLGALWVGIVPIVLAAWAWPGAAQEGTAAQDSPRLLAVAQASVALAASDGDEVEVGGELGQLAQGTTVEWLATSGRDDGLVKVRVEGWLPRAALTEAHAGRVPRVAASAAARGAPVAVLSRAHHVAVRPELRIVQRRRVVTLELELETLDGRPVVVAGSRLAGQLTVAPQRKIAGGHARGEPLLARAFELVEGRAVVELPLADLGDPAPPLVVFSASVELGGAVVLVGAASAVALPAR